MHCAVINEREQVPRQRKGVPPFQLPISFGCKIEASLHIGQPADAGFKQEGQLEATGDWP